MINIVIKRQKDHSIRLIEAKGHAGSGPYGFDLVCAGVSTVLMGGANALQGDVEKEFFEIKFDEGYALIRHKEDEIYNDKFLYTLETMFTMLKTIEQSNPKFIRITEKEI